MRVPFRFTGEHYVGHNPAAWNSASFPEAASKRERVMQRRERERKVYARPRTGTAEDELKPPAGPSRPQDNREAELPERSERGQSRSDSPSERSEGGVSFQKSCSFFQFHHGQRFRLKIVEQSYEICRVFKKSHFLKKCLGIDHF